METARASLIVELSASQNGFPVFVHQGARMGLLGVIEGVGDTRRTTSLLFGSPVSAD